MKQNYFVAIDLKSFYASVECIERGLDPLTTRLVVADESRTEKTICLAVTPALKAYGVPGRARLFEVVQKAKEYGLEFLIAKPRMALYVKYSTQIYNIYLRYVAPEDIHVYSIDEVFIDLTSYLETYQTTPEELSRKMVQAVFEETGITATAGIGTNMYLAKIAMDIVAKHTKPDENGVRMAFLDEMEYRKKLWNHRPLTDFWRVGRGYQKKLEENGLFTMGDIARCSLGKDNDFHNEDLLFKLFGVNAELLIDHAWGYEPCPIKEIKVYQPETNSVSNGQVLQHPYDTEAAKVVMMEMTDMMVLDLVEKKLCTDQIVINIGYDIDNFKNQEFMDGYKGEIVADHYGRKVPKPSHGSINLSPATSSTTEIMKAVSELFDRVALPGVLIRRMNVTANHLIPEEDVVYEKEFEQLDLFTDYSLVEQQKKEEQEKRQKEKNLQQAILNVKKKYGKNAILRGMNFREGATAIERNGQIGGHKA